MNRNVGAPPQVPGASRETAVDAATRRRWFALAGGHGVPDTEVDGALADVLAHYGQLHRHHHTFVHVLDVLGTLDELLADPFAPPIGAADRRALEGAAWLHDVIYDPSRPDNEEQSARYAQDVLGRLGVSADTVAEVARLILLTAGHAIDDDDRNGMFLADADLAILGAAPDRYERYARAIRAEYAAVPDDAYRTGRAAVLTSFLSRDRIYRTPPAVERFEDLARENLGAELAWLQAKDDRRGGGA